MHTLDYELVQLFHFGGGFPMRLELLGGLAGDQRSSKCHPVPQRRGTDFDSKGCERLGSLRGILPQRRNGIENDRNRRCRGANKGKRIGDSLQVQDRRPTRDEHKIGGQDCLQRRAVGMRRGVQIKGIASCLLEPGCFVPQAARMAGTL